MRPAFGIFLSALLWSGCSQKHTVYVDQSADIVAGKYSVWDGFVVSVKKRDGSSIEGIKIVSRKPDGTETITTADTGTVTQGPKQRFEAPPTGAKTNDGLRVVVIRNSVTIILSNALVQFKEPDGTKTVRVPKAEFVSLFSNND
jgi:hypothetical protein